MSNTNTGQLSEQSQGSKMGQYNFFIYSGISFSVKSAAATRMNRYSKALANLGHKVYITGFCRTEIGDANFLKQEPNIYVLQGNAMPTGIGDTLSFLKRLSQYSKSKEGDTIFLLYPSTYLSIEIWTLLHFKLINRFKVFYELNEVRKYDPSVQAPISYKRIAYSLQKVIFKTKFTLAQPLLHFYDGLICISTNIERYGKQFNQNTIRIPILTHPNTNFKFSNELYARKSTFNIGFAGSIHPDKENLDDFINVIFKLKDEGYKVSFNLCGSIFFPYKSHFLKKCELRDELNYYGLLNDIELSTFINQQDLLVVPRGFTLQNKYGFSTKLSDYLNQKKTVLVTDVSDNHLYIRDGENGFIVPPDNPELMFRKLTYIIENYKKIEKMVEVNAFQTANNAFNFMTYKDKLYNFLTT